MVVIPPSATDPGWVGRNQRSGSVDEEVVAEREEVFRESISRSVEDYQRLLDLGMAPEDPGSSCPSGRRSTSRCR